MKLNEDHYKSYLRVARKPIRVGLWDYQITENGMYCFATRQHLGLNGRLDSHPLYGVWFDRDGERFVVDSVNIHFLNGYYYLICLRNNKRSHTVAFYENINSIDPLVVSGIEEFKKTYTRL